MNKFVKDTFSYIKQEEANYRKAVESALRDYRATMTKAEQEAKKFKDESGYISNQKAGAKREAMTVIQLAENALTGVIAANVKGLMDDLHQHLTTRPSAAFLDVLRLYSDFDITPSHAEIEALMTLNGGCTIGYRALSQVLKKTNAEYTVDVPDASAYESDLAALEKLAHGNIRFVPDGYLREMVEVYGGEKRLLMRDDGSFYDAGYRWDATSLLTASTSYRKAIESIDAMDVRWSNTVLPSLKHLEAYKDNEETGETAAQQMAKDIKDTATAPEIERTNDQIIERVRQQAKEKAENDEAARQALDRFAVTK